MTVVMRLRVLHERVDSQARDIRGSLTPPLRCGPGCADCCIDGVTVLEVEAARIRAEFPDLLATGVPAAPGACAFLDDSRRCRIYSARPYVCRSQGLPLQWYEETEDGEVLRQRDICPLDERPGGLEALDEAQCFPLGVVEEELLDLNDELGGGEPRVELRALFARPPHARA